MQSGDFARKHSVTQRALRFYEHKGLLPPTEREGGYRIYTEKHDRILTQMLRLKQCGWTVQEIKNLLPENGSGEINAVLPPEEMVNAQIAFMEEDIASRKKGLDILRGFKAQYGETS